MSSIYIFVSTNWFFIKSYFCENFHVLKSQGVEFSRVSNHIHGGVHTVLSAREGSTLLSFWHMLVNTDALSGIKFTTNEEMTSRSKYSNSFTMLFVIKSLSVFPRIWAAQWKIRILNEQIYKSLKIPKNSEQTKNNPASELMAQG